jgi:hypothetical protein
MSLDASSPEPRPLEQVPEISQQEKARAVELVLASRTLARSELLRSFFRYVCEMALSGQPDQITEHLIGVRALGRRPDFSPGEDSSVRNRARGLRLKLEEFYREERPDLDLRIEIPVGSYCPSFHRIQPPQPAEPSVETMPLPVPRPPVRSTALLAGFGIGVLAAGMLAWLAWRWAPPQKPVYDASLVDFWGPLVQPNADVTISVATPPQLFVRSFPKDAPPKRKLLSVPSEVYSWYASGSKLDGSMELGILPTHNSPLWGDAAGAAIIGSFLSRAGASIQVRPERIIPFPAFRGRNSVVLGTPEYSPAAKNFLERGNFTIEYSNEAADFVIVNRKPMGQEPPYYAPRRASEQQIVDVYALITVLPSDGSPHNQHRTIVLSGLNSAGTQAAAEYITSAAYLSHLKQQFRLNNQTSDPSSYQVVIKSTTDATLPLNISHVTYRILTP